MKIFDTISLAWRTVRSNKLRTGLTVSIIAFGIMALVGINTAIEAMKQKFTESFSSMGANGFTIRFSELRFNNGNNDVKKEKKGQKKQKVSNVAKPITKMQAETFKSTFAYPATVGLYIFGARDAIASMQSKKTNPNIRVWGIDENYIDLNGYTIAAGRNLNKLDIQSARNVAILGKDVAAKLFGENLERPVEKMIKINNIPFRVVGTLNAKGSTLGMSLDNSIFTSYNNVRRYFNNNQNASFSIQVKVKDIKELEGAIGQAQGTFRPIRRLATTEEDNFLIDKSDGFVEMLMRNLSFITYAALIIGVITLAGAAIGLMNIMLVAVAERTREIGIRKSLGARRRDIMRQFLVEAATLSTLGAVIGIILGILLAKVVEWKTPLPAAVAPWSIVMATLLGMVVGIISGVYPAKRAAALDPIEALRKE